MNTNYKMLKLFENCIKNNKKEIKRLQHDYLFLKAQDDMIKREFAAADEQVLKTAVFTNKRTGEWITDPDGAMYKMNDNDFEKFLELSTAEHCKRGLTDSKGVYTHRGNAHNRLLQKREEITKFHLSIFPPTPEFDDIRKLFSSNLISVQNKLFDLFMSI